MTFHRRTKDVARRQWRGILMSMGMGEHHLTGRNVSCPICGGKDRFRWINDNGDGGGICNQCGGFADGAHLVAAWKGVEWKDANRMVDDILGNHRFEPDKPRPQMTDDDRRKLMLDTYRETVAVQPGDLVHAYLETRHVAERIYPGALRFGPRMRDGDGGVRPCMVALVGVHGDMDERGRQRFVTMHRTFLRPDGLGKAEMASPRKMMPGPVPDGACVMLSDWPGHGPIGIAEGIETAMSASALFDIPVWAALNATMLTKWLPPAGADEVVIFSDNDRSFTGQCAAYTLAKTLRKAQPDLDLKILTPPTEDTDWADAWVLHIGGKA